MSPRPPRWLERIAEWALPRGSFGHGAVGDLAEEFGRRSADSRVRARLWYAGQTLSILGYRGKALVAGDAGDFRSDTLTDLRWAVRLVLKHPAFAAGVVLVLGVGLGANVAVYSVVDGTFRNTSWWSAPDRTLGLWPEREWSFGMMEMYRDEQTVFRSVGGWREQAWSLRTVDGVSRSVNGVAISPELFAELQAAPSLGRALEADDAFLGAEPVAVIGESLWRNAFGSDPDVVGSTVDISGFSVRVVGVQAAGARAPGGRAELWLPLYMDPRDDDYFKAVNVKVVGVLTDGATADDAWREVDGFNDRLAQLFPTFFTPEWDDGLVRVARADESQRRLVATPLLLLLGGSALLLLVTALNVGNLLLGRAIERRGELAVRAAVGAGRARIVRQLVAEASVLTALGWVAALYLGAVGGPWLGSLFVGEVVVTSSSVASGPVLLFAVGAAVGAGLILAGVPVAHYLRSQGKRLALRPASGVAVQRTLVAVQAALATVLLVSATLLVATVGNLRRVPLGFDPDGLLTVQLSPPEDRLTDTTLVRGLYDRLVERVAAAPGVQAAGLTAMLPLADRVEWAPVNHERAPVDQVRADRAILHRVDPEFFDAMEMELVAGRFLGSEEREAGPSAVVVNRTMAEQMWPDASPLGQRIAIDPHAWSTFLPVVGVVEDMRNGEITGPPEPALYVSLSESPHREVSLVVRASLVDGGVVAAVRQAVNEVDPMVAIRSTTWMGEVVRAAYAVAWVIMGLLVALAVLATALGAIGIYAALNQHVAASRREIGVRMALGAEPGVVVRGVVRSGLIVAVAGIAAGSVVAAFSARALESLLFGVSTLSPWAYAAPAAALGLAAVLAGWVPAARAGSLPPAEVLRGE